ncbi:hypothetical protein [Brotaphodocola sp.]|uniref:hypothetical protein n=1 Tax=Brotaphodocola sp. TaxID=3073577 RepID=UPI003D7CCA8B
MGNIELDFQNAKSKSRELNEIASQLKKISNVELKDDITMISSAWKGDNASIFCRKLDKLDTKLEKEVKKMERSAESINRIAKWMYDAELRIQTFLRKR